MSSLNPLEYYENPDNHGSYSYVTLEEMVVNFMTDYTGDGKILNKVSRAKTIAKFKQGIKKFSLNALREKRAVELEMGDTLDIILPPDYVNYTRISYVNPDTGELMGLSRNNNIAMGNAYLQDDKSNLLFDGNGFILEGTTFFAELNDKPKERPFLGYVDCDCIGDYGFYNGYGVLGETNFRLDPSQNANGYFNIDTRQGRIHFSSENLTRVIMLEYISDGLEYSNESDIKVSKLVEEALYNFVNYELMKTLFGVPMYEKKSAEKAWYANYKNAKIAMLDIKIDDVMLFLNSKRKWIK
ncbi:MAG: hypothetical protein V4666_08325 [Bacteroidota bacterium]